jgi:hypothetical protein
VGEFKLLDIKEIRELFKLHQRIEDLTEEYNLKAKDLNINSCIFVSELTSGEKAEVFWKSSSEMDC